MQKENLIHYIEKALIFLWGIFLLTFPFFMLTITTDVFLLPKEIILTVVVLISLLLWGIKIVLSEKVALRRTPFDVPVSLFLFALLLSALFAVNRADSLIATVPVLVAGLGYFIFTNVIKKENAIVFMTASLLVGASAAAILAVFSYFKVYPLFFSFTHVQTFSTFGSLVEQAFYFGFLLPIGIRLALPLIKGKNTNQAVTFASLSVLLAAGLLVTLLELATLQKPIFLPFETGFQTAFAAISQDPGRVAQGFLLGSGYGNYASVFTRFKQASFNANPTLWSLPFANSSSFVLELLATTGIFGFLSFLFLGFRIVKNTTSKRINFVFPGLVLLLLVSFFLPFSFVEVALLFLLLGLFSAVQGMKSHKEYYDVELKFVTLKKGFISFQQVDVPSHEKMEYNKPTAVILACIFLLLIGVIGWYGGTFVLSDIQFEKSLVLAAANNGTGTYKEQINAINTFQYRSVYYRIFSQTNIALASSLASVLAKSKTPNQQIQSTMLTLVQQGITAAKQATALSPLSIANWQNLSSVYRSLISLGQNADTFAIQAAQQAVVLDPTNPQEFIALGGIYYQLGKWDNAIQAFQQAISLKQDYANAYYNLGHAYEQKQDYQNALAAYQAVKTLVGNDPNNSKVIDQDIAAVEAKLGNQQASPTPTPTSPKVTPNPKVTQQPLNLSGQQSTVQGQTPTQQAPSPAPVQ